MGRRLRVSPAAAGSYGPPPADRGDYDGRRFPDYTTLPEEPSHPQKSPGFRVRRGDHLVGRGPGTVSGPDRWFKPDKGHGCSMAIGAVFTRPDEGRLCRA